MDERLTNWHPRPDEVERIVDEMRPLIADLVRLEQARFVIDALTTLTPVGVRPVTVH